jgi:hypothetical protein
MKKILVLLVILSMMGGCAMFQKPCSENSQAQMVKATIVLNGIQKYYNPLQALVPLIPTAGPILAIAIPAALAAADLALQNLGAIIASNCANDSQVTLAEIALNSIEKVFSNPEVKAALATPQAQMNLKMLQTK